MCFHTVNTIAFSHETGQYSRRSGILLPFSNLKASYSCSLAEILSWHPKINLYRRAAVRIVHQQHQGIAIAREQSVQQLFQCCLIEIHWLRFVWYRAMPLHIMCCAVLHPSMSQEPLLLSMSKRTPIFKFFGACFMDYTTFEWYISVIQFFVKIVSLRLNWYYTSKRVLRLFFLLCFLVITALSFKRILLVARCSRQIAMPIVSLI